MRMSNTAVDTSKLPPMLVQYLEYKGRYPDCLLLFQVGDFYEVFFDDALIVSRALNLTLTSRDKNSPNPIPMCGVPIGVVEGYLERLMAQRFSVAIVSQTEEAVAGKGPVARALERIVTPGIRLLSHSDSDAPESIVAAIAIESELEAALAYTDVQTGRIFIREGLERSHLIAELKKVAPAEIVIPSASRGQKVDRRLTWVRDLESMLGQAAIKFRVDASHENGARAARDLAPIPGYSVLGGLAKRAVRLLAGYIDEVTAGAIVPLRECALASETGALTIDSMTRANLELIRNSRDGARDGSLYHFIDRSVSVGGSRLLKQWVLAPLADRGGIERRLDAVQSLVESTERESLRGLLRGIPDLERIAARLELGVAGPRELASLRDVLAQMPAIRAALTRVGGAEGGLLRSVTGSLNDLPETAALLERALVTQPPYHLKEGGIIRDGFDADLDRLMQIRHDGKAWIAALETEERTKSGIASLKIRFNNVFGFFIEITNANLNKVPAHYVRRQTTANGERFVTEELKKRETEILGAEDAAVKRERELFIELREQVRSRCADIRGLAEQLGLVDAAAALAELADREGYVRPEILDNGALEIVKGKHPVLAAALQGEFIPNTLSCDDPAAPAARRCMLITGPNMGGKSTYLRQTALIAILAQMGSFVPAQSARIGLVDKIFARIGASDNLREGESTFMVEMREASSIVANATERSLILIDEIGRGTATLDGLALARAILEWLVVKTRARILFATHFHELTVLESAYPAIANLSVGSEERGDSIIFTHEIREGAASRSYGLEVADLAGLPAELMARARELLAALVEERESQGGASVAQLSLFTPPKDPPKESDEVRRLRGLGTRISEIDVDQLTPLEALNLLSTLRAEWRRG